MSTVTTDVQQGGVTVRPLQPAIGAEIGGVDLRNYGDFPRLLQRILIADEPQYADL